MALKWFNDLSIRSKLIVLILTVSLVIAVLVGGARLAWDWKRERQSMAQELSTLANLLGDRSSAALVFDDARLGQENLASLHTLPYVIQSCLYQTNGTLLTQYRRNGANAQCPPASQMTNTTTRFEMDKLTMVSAIQKDQQVLGWIYIESDLSVLEAHLQSQLVFSILALMAAVLVTGVLAGWVQRLIAGPVEAVTAVARDIKQRGDYSRRAPVTATDEVGELARSFNAMLDALQVRTDELATARAEQESLLIRYRNLFDYANDAIILIDVNTNNIIDINPVTCVRYGYTREELLNMNLSDLSAPEALGDLPNVISKIRLEGKAVFERLHRAKDGRSIPVEVSSQLLELEGRPVFLAIVRDLTERKRTEEAIKNIAAGVSSKTGEDFFQQLVIYLSKLFDTKYAFIGLVDDKDPMLINTLAVSVHGIISDNISYRLEDTPCANVVGQSTCAHPSGVRRKFPKDTLLQQMGVESYIGTPLFDAAGRPLGLIVLLDDKPLQHTEWMGEILQIFASRAGAELERVRAEQDLYIKERAMEAATEGIVLTDAGIDNPMVYVNRAMEMMTGYTRDELLGRNPRLLQGPDSDSTVVNQLHAAVAQQQPCHVELLNYRKDGTLFWNEITITPVHNESGEVTHYIGTQLDVTTRHQTEEALRRSQKMEAVGQLAGGVAHDFNNQLGVIIGYLDFLRDRLAGDEKLSKWVGTATQATLRCMDLTRQLLAFSRRKTKQTSVADLNRELARMDTLITRSITPAITVQIFPGENVWPVAIDVGEFQDAVLNLVLNARDAMPEGGRLSIETANKLVDAQYAGLNPELAPGDYVQVLVSDTGRGMDKATMERIFEPFFTTKPEGKGTGLGLAMVYGFARRYGGDIKVYSELGIGTTFRLYLPRATENAATKGSVLELPRSMPGGSETILVVDDEPELLGLAVQYLESLGYQTLRAGNPREALMQLRQRADIDVLFSDVVMPGDINGYALAEQARKILPGLKVLLTSGFTDNTVTANSQVQLAVSLLTKPYRQDELARRVRAVLDQENDAC